MTETVRPRPGQSIEERCHPVDFSTAPQQSETFPTVPDEDLGYSARLVVKLRAENERLRKALCEALERADKLVISTEQHMAADVRYRVDQEWWAALCGDDRVLPAPRDVAIYVLGRIDEARSKR